MPSKLIDLAGRVEPGHARQRALGRHRSLRRVRQLCARDLELARRCREADIALRSFTRGHVLAAHHGREAPRPAGAS